jgi:hypothetical protein
VDGRTTDSRGRVAFSYETPGTRTFKASKPDTVRSNALTVPVMDAEQVPAHADDLVVTAGAQLVSACANRCPRQPRRTFHNRKGFSAGPQSRQALVHDREPGSDGKGWLGGVACRQPRCSSAALHRVVYDGQMVRRVVR